MNKPLACFEGWSAEHGNSAGRCCCNCANQILLLKHPWNTIHGKGSIAEPFGAACAPPDMTTPNGKRSAIFFESGHSMCEMWDERSPSSGSA